MVFFYVIPAIAVLIAAALFELRFRKPDQLALFEKNQTISLRKGRIYPRHFTLIIPSSVYSYDLEINAEAKGKLKALVKMSISIAADANVLSELVRAGGWNTDAVAKASREINTKVTGFVQSHCATHDIDEISAEKLADFLETELKRNSGELGLKVINLNIQSVEPEDISITEAIRQRESARIMEQTERVNQNARIVAKRAKLDADETIAGHEHQLELKRIELKKIEEEQEALLAQKRIQEEIANKKLKLEIEKEELNVLTAHPELMVLSPQIAKLAEATRNLKNAQTVVSLTGKELSQESGLETILSETIARFVEKLNSGSEKND